MPLKNIRDDDGKEFTVLDYNGYTIATFPDLEKRMEKIPKMTARPDDVWVCAYPKSGTHWICEICYQLLNDTTDLSTKPKEDFMLENADPEFFDNMPKPRIINTHFLPEYLPQDVWPKNSKVIQIVRNPKDVAVSYYNHIFGLKEYGYSGTFSAYLKLFLYGEMEYGTWWDYVRVWNKFSTSKSNILWLTYEDTKSDPIGQIRAIAKFLKCEKDEKVYAEVATATSFKSMKQNKVHWVCDAEAKEDINFGEWKSESEGWFRKGTVGDWKNWMTVAENEHFDKLYNEKMSGIDKSLPDGVRIRFQI